MIGPNPLANPRHLGSLLGIEAEVLQVGLGHPQASTGEVAVRTVHPLTRIVVRVSLRRPHRPPIPLVARA